jgi:hypothetical protein
MKNTRKCGIEKMQTVFKRKNSNNSSTLIVGCMTQFKMLYVTPALIARLM